MKETDRSRPFEDDKESPWRLLKGLVARRNVPWCIIAARRNISFPYWIYRPLISLDTWHSCMLIESSRLWRVATGVVAASDESDSESALPYECNPSFKK